jgi:hypothetical protein
MTVSMGNVAGTVKLWSGARPQDACCRVTVRRRGAFLPQGIWIYPARGSKRLPRGYPYPILAIGRDLCHGVTMRPDGISIKELHEKTGELVREAGEARIPVPVTDRGKIVAVLGSPKLVKAGKRPKRGLPQEYRDFVKTLPRTDVMRYMDEERER